MAKLVVTLECISEDPAVIKNREKKIMTFVENTPPFKIVDIKTTKEEKKKRGRRKR